MMDPKKTALLILAKKKPAGDDAPPPPDSDSGSDGDDSEGLKSAAEDVLSAVKDGDADALAEALHSFVEMCGQ